MERRDRAQSILDDARFRWGLGIVALALFVIANLPWQLDDYDQAKQAFTSFQMVTEGHWLYQTTPHERLATKPPLVGWTSAALHSVSRSWDVAWRLPSLLAAAVIAFLLLRKSRSAYGAVAATVTFAAFAFNLITPRLATLVRTDMPLTLIVFAIGGLIWEKIRAGKPWTPNERTAICLLLTAGMLIKGPVVLAFLLPGVLAFRVWQRAGVSASPGMWPWVVSAAVFLLWVGGGIVWVPGFYDEVVVREFLGRFGGQVHRSQPLLFYLPHLLHKFAPWSLLMIGLGLIELRNVGWHWRRLHISAPTRWLICWSVGALVLMSLLPSKRVDRIFPVIPPFCLLLGAQIFSVGSGARLRTVSYRLVAATLAFALVFSGGYVIWKVVSGYRQNREALARFGNAVREQAIAGNWRFGVVSAPDESLLLYLHKSGFVPPERALADWNAGALDALVVSTRHSPELVPQLKPSAEVRLRSDHRPDGDTLDYLLLTKTTANSKTE